MKFNCACVWRSLENSLNLISDICSRIVYLFNFIIINNEKLNSKISNKFGRFKPTYRSNSSDEDIENKTLDTPETSE